MSWRLCFILKPKRAMLRGLRLRPSHGDNADNIIRLCQYGPMIESLPRINQFCMECQNVSPRACYKFRLTGLSGFYRRRGDRSPHVRARISCFPSVFPNASVFYLVTSVYLDFLHSVLHLYTFRYSARHLFVSICHFFVILSTTLC